VPLKDMRGYYVAKVIVEKGSKNYLYSYQEKNTLDKVI